MNLNEQVNAMISHNMYEEFDRFYNELKDAIESGSLKFFTTVDDSILYEKAKNKAIDLLTDKEKFNWYYENS